MRIISFSTSFLGWFRTRRVSPTFPSDAPWSRVSCLFVKDFGGLETNTDPNPKFDSDKNLTKDYQLFGGSILSLFFIIYSEFLSSLQRWEFLNVDVPSQLRRESSDSQPTFSVILRETLFGKNRAKRGQEVPRNFRSSQHSSRVQRSFSKTCSGSF